MKLSSGVTALCILAARFYGLYQSFASCGRIKYMIFWQNVKFFGRYQSFGLICPFSGFGCKYWRLTKGRSEAVFVLPKTCRI
jgi:hypothetical protein